MHCFRVPSTHVPSSQLNLESILGGGWMHISVIILLCEVAVFVPSIHLVWSISIQCGKQMMCF